MAKTQGLDNLKKQLSSLPKSVAEAVEYQMSENAYDLADAIKGYAPVKTGALAESVGFGPGDAPDGAAMGPGTAPDPVGDSLSDKGLRWSVWAGSRKAFYARWVEFGTRAYSVDKGANSKSGKLQVGKMHPGTKAQPFSTPAVRAKAPGFKTSITRAMNRAAKAAANQR